MIGSPRHITHRGSVLAAGFWIAADAQRDVERLVLALWDRGAEVRRLRDGYVVVLGTPRRVQAELGHAAPLLRREQRLLSATLSPSELATLPASSNLALVLGGAVVTAQLEQLELCDVAGWLEVDSFLFNETSALGVSRRPPLALTAPADGKQLFEQSVGRTAEQTAHQAELSQALEAVERGTKQPSKRAGIGWQLKRFLAWLLQPRAAGAIEPARRARPSWWDRFTATLATWVARSRWGEYLGRKQAEYLQQLLEVLAQHDDEEVLRRAIPLSDGNGTGQSRPALSAPQLRS